jgi:hypothetical protein
VKSTEARLTGPASFHREKSLSRASAMASDWTLANAHWSVVLRSLEGYSSSNGPCFTVQSDHITTDVVIRKIPSAHSLLEWWAAAALTWCWRSWWWFIDLSWGPWYSASTTTPATQRRIPEALAMPWTLLSFRVSILSIAQTKTVSSYVVHTEHGVLLLVVY